VRLPAGPIRLRTNGDGVRVNLLRLRSAAPNPATVPLSPGRVLDTGEAQRGGGRDGVRIQLDAPGTLVLGQSYSDGWRATCDGRSLGKPRVVDGYANAWDVEPPCEFVEFAFAPDRPVRAIQLASAIACLLLLAFVLLRRLLPANRPPICSEQIASGIAGSGLLPANGSEQMVGSRVPMTRALALGLLAGAVLGFCFSLRAGLAIFVGVTLIVRFGIGPRVLALAAGALLAIVVPALYLLFPADDRGGYNPGYAGEQIEAHWVGVAAFALLAVALVQTLSTARRRSRSAAAASAAADA
jgi:hypothetical protein